MLGIECTHNDGIHIWMRQCEAQEERRAAFPRLAQLIQTGFLKLLPAIFVTEPNTYLAPCDATADDRPDACLRCTADPILMSALQSRIRDLEGIEHPPMKIGGQMRQGCRDADEAYLSLLLHLFESIHQLILLCDAHRRIVQLHNVDIVGLHTLKA